MSQALREKSQEDKTDSLENSSTVHILTTETLSGQEGSQFHRQEYSMLQAEAYQLIDTSNTNRLIFMSNSTSQPISPIALTHLSSTIDHERFMEDHGDNIHAI